MTTRFWLATVIIGLSIFLPVEPNLAAPASMPLAIEFEAISNEVKLKDPFPTFRVTVTNVSNKAVRIPTKLRNWGYFETIRPDGNREEYLHANAIVFIGSHDETVLLPPGAWYGQRFERVVSFDGPGKWTVAWALYIPTGNSEVAMDELIVMSKPIVVTVMP